MASGRALTEIMSEDFQDRISALNICLPKVLFARMKDMPGLS